MKEKNGLVSKDFVLVVIGQIISLFGNNVLRFALPLYIYDQSSSAVLFGLVSAASFLPIIIMSPIGGIIADRVNKQKMMVVLDTITAILLVGFMLLYTSVSMVPLVVITLMILYGIQGVYTPSVQASIPLLVGRENLIGANAVVNLVQSLSGLLGPSIGGILYSMYGLGPIIIVSSICFAFSALIELFIRIPHIKQAAPDNIWQMVKGDMKESLHFVSREYPVMFKVMIMIFAVNLFLTSMIVIGMPVIITGFLGLGSDLYGYNQGWMSAGGLLGGVLAGVWGKRMEIRRSWQLLFLCALTILPMGAVLLADISSLSAYFVITACVMFMMVFATMFSIQMMAFTQMVTPPGLVGKVISCIMATSLCAQPIGQILFGLAFQIMVDMPGVIVLAAGVISLGFALYSKRAFGQLEGVDHKEGKLIE